VGPTLKDNRNGVFHCFALTFLINKDEWQKPPLQLRKWRPMWRSGYHSFYFVFINYISGGGEGEWITRS